MDEAVETFIEGHRGLESQRTELCRVEDEMTVVPDAKAVAGFERPGPAEAPSEVLGQLAHAARLAGAHIENLEGRALVLGREQGGPHDIVHVDPVALLPTVLVEKGGLAAGEP